MEEKPDINYYIGLRVGYLRRRERKSQMDLAKEIGMTRIMLSNIESGRVPLKIFAAWTLCWYMHVHPNYLFYGGDDWQTFPIIANEDFAKLDKIYRANKDAAFADTWEVLGVLLFESEEKKRLTDISQKGNTTGVQTEIQRLIERVKKKASVPGAKADLARKLDVAPARISEWLSGVKEPGGNYTLRLLRWVSQQEGLIK